MEKLLRLDKRPTVVFACSDSIAIGVYQTAWRHGLRIPQDISVMTISPSQNFYRPPLSTIHQPKNRLAKLAVETLLERIKNPQKSYRTFQLEPELIERESISYFSK